MKKMITTLATLALVLSLGLPTFAAAKSAQEAQKTPSAQTKAPATKSTKKSTKKHSQKHTATTSAKKDTKVAGSAPAATPKQ